MYIHTHIHHYSTLGINPNRKCVLGRVPLPKLGWSSQVKPEQVLWAARTKGTACGLLGLCLWMAAGHGLGTSGSTGFVPCTCLMPTAAEFCHPFATPLERTITVVPTLQAREQISSSPSSWWQLHMLPRLMRYDRSDVSKDFHLHYVAVSNRWNHKINLYSK